jgi:hypothetical protein
MFQVGLLAYKVRSHFATPPDVTVAPPVTVAPTPRKTFPDCEMLDDFVDHDRLSYRHYEIVKQYKKIRFDDAGDGPLWADVSFAQLRQDSKTVKMFDGLYHTTGNSTDFGLFKLLGNNDSQLVVQQIAWRGGENWIFDLSGKNARRVYSGEDWGVGRGEMCVIDLNVDGTMEISEEITAFYDLQDKFAISWIPLTPIVFKYNQRTRRYEPANNEFLEYSLGGVPVEDASVSSSDAYEQSRIISTLLDYVFAGQREKGWAFFERNYRGDDKGEMRRRVQSILNKQFVYRFIYKSQDRH